jgi:hypothetical protein
MYQDTDSVSTFHPVTPSDKSEKTQPSTIFHPKIVGNSAEHESDSVSKMSDADSRISSLEYNFHKFQMGMNNIK